MKFKTCLFFLAIHINLINYTYGEEALYLLQSVENKDQVELLTTTSNLNLIHINHDCQNCFINLPNLLNATNQSFVIITGKKHTHWIKKNVLEKYKIPPNLWSFFYSDVGLRLSSSLNLENSKSRLISYRKGKFKVTDEISLDRKLPTEKQLELWSKR